MQQLFDENGSQVTYLVPRVRRNGVAVKLSRKMHDEGYTARSIAWKKYHIIVFRNYCIPSILCVLRKGSADHPLPGDVETHPAKTPKAGSHHDPKFIPSLVG